MNRNSVVHLAASFIVAATAMRAASPCDDSIESAGGRSGYQSRDHDDRCEGLFTRKEAASAVRLIGFTAGIVSYHPAYGTQVTLIWPPSQSAIHLRASSTTAGQAGLFFRMDTIRKPGDTAYKWDLGLLAQLSLPGAPPALVAFTEDQPDNLVYHPILGDGSRSGPLKLMFLTTENGIEALEAYGCRNPAFTPAKVMKIGYRPPFQEGDLAEVEIEEHTGRSCLTIKTTFASGSESKNFQLSLP